MVARDLLARLGDRWSVQVASEAVGGPIRFTELRRKIQAASPISARVLAHTLKQLERDGLLLRTAYPTVPPRVEYSVSQLGEQFLTFANRFISWTVEHESDFAAARKVFEERR